MFATTFNFTPMGSFPNFPLFDIYAQQTRSLIQMQLAVADMITMGLISDFREEIEHSMVEGADVAETLIEKLQNLDTQYVDETDKQFLVDDAINHAQENLKAVMHEFALATMALPFQRMSPKPPRKRFPVTLDGEVVNK